MISPATMNLKPAVIELDVGPRQNVRFGSQADVCIAIPDVRPVPESGYELSEPKILPVSTATAPALISAHGSGRSRTSSMLTEVIFVEVQRVTQGTVLSRCCQTSNFV